MIAESKNFRKVLENFFESSGYKLFLTVLIIASIFTIGIELSLDRQEGFAHVAYIFNRLVVVIFAVEMVARVTAHGFSFFKDPWHIFDFIIILVSVFTFGGYFQLLRAFRLFWLLRLVSFFPQFQHVVDAIGKAIPQMLSTAFLLFIAIYIFALVGMSCFSADNPELYGTVWKSMSSIAQSVIMPHTWSEQLAELSKITPYAWVFIIPMVIILNFLLLQLILGIIIGALMRQHTEDEQAAKHLFFEKWLENQHTPEEVWQNTSAETKMILHKISLLHKEIKDLKKP
jgi:voltage-gated sodium channel